MSETEKKQEEANESELDEVQEDLSEEMPEIPPSQVFSILEKLPDAPSQAQVDHWKTQHVVRASIFSEKEVYLWRPITWHEYKMLKATAEESPQNQYMFDEHIVYKCVLWPAVTPDKVPVLKGGTIPTLSQQIMEGSNFIPPQIAMNFVVEL